MERNRPPDALEAPAGHDLGIATEGPKHRRTETPNPRTFGRNTDRGETPTGLVIPVNMHGLSVFRCLGFNREWSDTMAETSAEPDLFDRVWAALAARSHCDGLGGAECTRVRQEWEDAGRPQRIASYIRWRANIGPMPENDKGETW